jgi:hypothetical protein
MAIEYMSAGVGKPTVAMHEVRGTVSRDQLV